MYTRIGPYRLGRVVGRGGLGIVYRAIDMRSGHSVALKLLNRPAADAIAARRLAREFRAMRQLEHRNIVRVLDAGVDDEDVPYLVMELVEGLALRGYLDVAKSESDPDWAPVHLASTDDSLAITVDAALSDSGSAPLPSWLSGDDEPDSLPPLPRRGATGGPTGPLPLEERLRLNRPARIDRLRDVLAQLCDGLAFIHARALVHRDVKPSNVLVTDGGCAKLVDFGLVKATSGGGHTTGTGHVVGTWRYLAPEQARSAPVDGRSDLYALGGVLYEMLCGRPPFTQTSPTALLQAIVSEAPVHPRLVNPEVDSTLALIAMRLLQKEPEARFQSAEEVAGLLRSALPAGADSLLSR